jgi:hypothetical protein
MSGMILYDPPNEVSLASHRLNWEYFLALVEHSSESTYSKALAMDECGARLRTHLRKIRICSKPTLRNSSSNASKSVYSKSAPL